MFLILSMNQRGLPQMKRPYSLSRPVKRRSIYALASRKDESAELGWAAKDLG
jgi:hypothetical protein